MTMVEQDEEAPTIPVPFLLDIGHEQAAQGNWEGARVSFQHAVAQLVQQQQQQQQPLKSIDGYQRAVALANLGHCCTKLGRHDQAAAHGEASLELKRGYYRYEARAAGGSYCSNSQNLDLAGALEEAGQARMRCGDYVAAERHYTEALDMKRLLYGKQQQHQKHHHEALDMKRLLYGKQQQQHHHGCRTSRSRSLPRNHLLLRIIAPA